MILFLAFRPTPPARPPALGRTPRARGPRRGPLAPYRRLFSSVPGALAFTLAGLLGRLPATMLGVADVVMIALTRDSYALAGAVSATGVAVTAVASPLTGGLVDRHGQARIAVPAVAVFAAGSAAMLLCVRYEAPAWTLFVCCAGSSGVPSLGSMTRARWAYAHRDDAAARHTANSFEQVLDELCFVLGPALAMVLCTAVAPEAGLATAAVLLTVGTLSFAAQRRTEPPVHARVAGGARAPLRAPGFPVVLITFVATGALFGSMEVTTVAAVGALGAGAASGAVLALKAAGSGLAGLVFGALRPRGRTADRFVGGVTAMALCVLPLTTADTLPALAGLLFIAGMATAPTMVTGMTLVHRLVPASRLNEGMTTAYTGLLIGISTGAAAAGQAVEHLGPTTAYWTPALAAVLATATALTGLPRLRTATTSPGGRSGHRRGRPHDDGAPLSPGPSPSPAGGPRTG